MDKEEISSFLKSCFAVSLIFSLVHVGVGLTDFIPASYWTRDYPIAEQGQIGMIFDLFGFVFYGSTILFLVLFLLWVYIIPENQNRKLRQPKCQVEQERMSEEKRMMLIKAQEAEMKTKKREENERIRRLEAEINAEFRRMQMEKGLIRFVDRDGNDRGWGTKKQVREWMKIDSNIINNFRNLTPHEFESFVKDLFVKMGYEAKLTTFFGSDVIATKGNDTVIIEVKRYDSGNNISPEQVRLTLGSMWFHSANKAIIVTTSDFSVAAKEQTKGSPIELWNGVVLCEMVEKYFLSPKVVNDSPDGQFFSIENSFDLKALSVILEKFFPAMVKLDEYKGFIWVTEKIKVSEKGVIEGSGPIAEYVQGVYRLFTKQAAVN